MTEWLNWTELILSHWAIGFQHMNLEFQSIAGVIVSSYFGASWGWWKMASTLYTAFCWAYEALLCSPSAVLRLSGGLPLTISLTEPGFREQPWNHLLTDYLFHSLSNHILLALSFFQGSTLGMAKKHVWAEALPPEMQREKGQKYKIKIMQKNYPACFSHLPHLPV